MMGEKRERGRQERESSEIDILNTICRALQTVRVEPGL